MANDLLSDIEKFMAEVNLGPHRFGILAASNGRLVERLRDGKRVWPDTEQQVRKFMREYRRKAKATSQPEQAVAS
jgi:hypothetical protein